MFTISCTCFNNATLLENQTYNLSVAQGTLNPNLKNINTRLVNIEKIFPHSPRIQVHHHVVPILHSI